MVRNLQTLNQALRSNNEPAEPKCLDENDLASQQIFSLDTKLTDLKEKQCSICLNDIADKTLNEEEMKKVMVCELTCGHCFHAPCVLGWLTK